MKFYATLTVTIIVVLLLSEVAPQAVNALLILILMGLVLGRYEVFQGLINTIASGVGYTAK